MEKTIDEVSKLLFPDEAETNKTPSEKFNEQIRRQVLEMKRQRNLILNEIAEEDGIDESYREIADFIRAHVINVGKEQSVKDFQAGLNFLHKDLKESLKEDGDFGEKTFKAFYEIFKHYDVEIIKNAIRKGALSNAIIGTSSNSAVNTKSLINKIQNNLGVI